MNANKVVKSAHPLGERSTEPESFPPPHKVETFGGAVEIRWEEDNAVSLHGPLAYFIEFF